MSRTAAKRKAPLPVLVAPEGRDALSDAITAREKVEAAIKKQRAAIEKASAHIYEADDEIERLRKAIPAAEESDTKRAASILKNPKGTVAHGWSGDTARRAVEAAEERLALTRRARERLEAELRDLEDEKATCDNAVTIAIKQLTVPTVEKLVTEVREGKRRLAVAQHLLNYLVAPENGPSFHNFLRARAAHERRNAVLAELSTQAQQFQFANYQAENLDTLQAAVAAWSRALSELRLNPACKLPGED